MNYESTCSERFQVPCVRACLTCSPLEPELQYSQVLQLLNPTAVRGVPSRLQSLPSAENGLPWSFWKGEGITPV